MIKDDAKCPTSIYHLLVIITDGTIHDLDEMKRQLIKNQDSPISVCIIGVGDENFSKMYQLDCKTKRLEDKNGNKSDRDICQFVRYKDFRDNPDKIAEHLLTIIPSQIEKYYRRTQNFIGLFESGKNKNIHIKKFQEEQKKEKLLSKKSKSNKKKSSVKFAQKEKLAEEKSGEDKDYIETNMDQIEA